MGCPAPTTPSGSSSTSVASAGETSPNVLAADPLAVSFEPKLFVEQPKLLERLRSRPFAYFRFIAAPFARAVCEELHDDIARMPTVNLHGDLHLEQYAVADDGFGLVDFDDSTKGPPVLDWLRLATSVWIAASDEDSAEYAIARFIDGYRVGLAQPDAVLAAPEPPSAQRVRRRFNSSAEEWLDRVTALIEPLDEHKREMLARARDGYVQEILTQNPDLKADFFNVKRGGALKMGIGSAHEAKFLVRVEGPTLASEDDVLLEAKQMKRDLLGSCVRGDASDPHRVIDAQTKFSRGPQRLLGHVQVDDTIFYIHQWRVHYTELSIADLKSRQELAALTYDIGLQLGRGHPMHRPETPEGKAERRAILAALDEVAGDVFEASRELAKRTRVGFEQFHDASGPSRAPSSDRK